MAREGRPIKLRVDGDGSMNASDVAAPRRLRLETATAEIETTRSHLVALRHGALALGAALATALAFCLDERFQWPWLVLGWVAMVPWLAVLDGVGSARAAVRHGLLMALLFTVVTFNWFADSIHAYTGAPWIVGVLFMALLAPILEPQFITFALARHLARRHGGALGVWRGVFVGACVYAGTDWFWPKLFGDTLGYGVYPSVWMRQAADVGGVHGLTFLLVVSNECVLLSLRALAPGQRRNALAPAACVIAIVLMLLGYGAVRYGEFHDRADADRAVTAGLIQADMSHYNEMAAELGTYEGMRRILDTHFALSTQAMKRAPLDFLVWPETVYPTTFGSPKSADGAAFDRELGGFVNATGIPLVFGAYDAEGGDEYNAAMFLEPVQSGKVSFDTYRKASLFPLTERLPKLFEFDWLRHWFPWLGTWKPGTGTKVVPFTLHDGRTLLVAPLICYDAVDPNLALAAVRRGAELIVTISNDVWFGYGPTPYGHLVYAAFRSIETRRPQLRATNTGMSAVITSTGELVMTAGVHERAALVGTVTPERHATTPLLAWGDWFGPTVLAVAGMLLVVPQLSGAPRQRTPRLRGTRRRRR